MIAAWMIYASAVTALLWLGAAAVEMSLRIARRPGRWILAFAIVAAIVVPVFSRSEPVAVTSGGADVASLAQTSPLASFTAILPDVAPLHRLNFPLTVLWIGASALLVTLVLLTQAQLARKISNYPEESLCGTNVRRSLALGPAVVGWLKSRIVIPAWVDEVGKDWRELMVRHEQEHLRSKDAQLLSAAILIVALQPWNIPLWFLLLRLRRAIELDCDQRILRSGVDLRVYGNLLIEMSRRRTLSPLPIVGLAVSRPFLARRVKTMTVHRSPFRYPRALVATALGALFVAIACLLPAPLEPPAMAAMSLPEISTTDSDGSGMRVSATRSDVTLSLQPTPENLWRIRKALNASAVLNSVNLELLPEDLVARLRNAEFLMTVTEKDGKPEITLRMIREADRGLSAPHVFPEPIG